MKCGETAAGVVEEEGIVRDLCLEPIHVRVAILRRPEPWPVEKRRILVNGVQTTYCKSVMRREVLTWKEGSLDSCDHVLLPVRVCFVGINLPKRRCVRIVDDANTGGSGIQGNPNLTSRLNGQS